MIEIVKREFLLLNSQKGAGLWQYNQTAVYSREEIHAWEEQQRKRKQDGTVSKDKGKGKAVSATTGDHSSGKDARGQTTVQPMDTDEPQVQRPAEPVTETSTRGDQVLRELLTGSNQ